MMNALNKTLHGFKKFSIDVYDFFELSFKAFIGLFFKPLYFKDILYQMQFIGVGSLPIVALTSFFTGMILALQSGVAMAVFGAKMYVGTVVSLSIVLELGPMLTAIVVAGRVGASIAAELGSMKVTEQIDAMRAMATDPIKKLVTTRLIAGLIMIPALTFIGDFLGIMGGAFVAINQLGLIYNTYIKTVFDMLSMDFLFIGFVKPFFFSTIIILVASYTGLNTKGGTEGVGKSTTNSVVISSILILVSDYFLNIFLFWILGVSY
ncbi:MAG: MlaE family ABC transporter permease [Candidatus Zixiibacteriota bacterium]